MGLCFGFNISFPPISTTQAPLNKESIVKFTDEFNKIIHNKTQKGCYIGLISGEDVEALIGPFQSLPFPIIPKPGQVGKYRNIQNYSFLNTPSTKFPNSPINSCVDSDLFART